MIQSVNRRGAIRDTAIIALMMIIMALSFDHDWVFWVLMAGCLTSIWTVWMAAWRSLEEP